MILLRLGLKNLSRHIRRSLITVLSIGFGLATILWLQAILNGTSQTAVDTVTSNYLGQMQISRKDYLRDKLINQTFNYDKISLPSDVISSPRIHLPALISSGEQSMPIMLEGIDPEAESKITRVKERLVAGEFLEEEASGQCKNKSAYVGRALANVLKVGVGEKIVLLAQAADGSLGNELFRIKGLFDSGSPDYDKGVVIANIECVREIGALHGMHDLVIKTTGRRTPEQIQKQLKTSLADSLKVLTWRDLSSSLVTMTTFNNASLILVSVILFVVISLGILNTFLVAVFERTKEFGVMMALGTPGASVIKVVLWEAFFLGLASSILGIFVATLIISYHSRFGFDLRPLVGQNLSVGNFQIGLTVYPVIDWVGSAKATVVTWMIVVIATFYPAFRASRLKPAEAIRSH